MPDLDLGPENYREKGRRRVVRASRGLLLFVTVLAIWAGLVLVFFSQWFPDTARVWAFVTAFGPFVLVWLWLAIND